MWSVPQTAMRFSKTVFGGFPQLGDRLRVVGGFVGFRVSRNLGVPCLGGPHNMEYSIPCSGPSIHGDYHAI